MIAKINSVRLVAGEMVCTLGKCGPALHPKIAECLAEIADEGYLNEPVQVTENRDGTHTVRFRVIRDVDATPPA